MKSTMIRIMPVRIFFSRKIFIFQNLALTCVAAVLVTQAINDAARGNGFQPRTKRECRIISCANAVQCKENILHHIFNISLRWQTPRSQGPQIGCHIFQQLLVSHTVTGLCTTHEKRPINLAHLHLLRRSDVGDKAQIWAWALLHGQNFLIR